MSIPPVLHWLFGPHMFDVGAIACVGIGVGMALSSDPKDISAALWFFGIAAVLAAGRAGHWLVTEDSPPLPKPILAVVLFGAIGALWIISYSWTHNKLMASSNRQHVSIRPDRVPLYNGFMEETTVFLSNADDSPAYSIWLEIASTNVPPDSVRIEVDDGGRERDLPGGLSVVGDSFLLPGIRNGHDVVFVIVTFIPPHSSLPIRISGTLPMRSDAALSIISASPKVGGFASRKGEAGFTFVSPLAESVKIRGVAMRLKKRSQQAQ